MKKCAFLFSLGLLFLCVSCSKSETVVSEPMEQPNIVWIVCEDQSPDFLPMYGDTTISVPNLSSLAAESVVYDNAYSPAPVCAPARSSLITGMYQTTLGTHNMRTYSAYNSKNQPSIQIPAYSPIAPDNVKVFTEALRLNGYYCTNNAKEDYNFKTLTSTWDVSGNKAHWRNRKEGQPFFAVFNYGITHESQVWKNGKKELLVAPNKVPVPPIFPDDPVIRHDLAVNYSNLMRLDAQVGAVISQLKEDGLYEDSYIFFYGDHGGPFPRYKRSVYETGTKVPLFVKLPKGKQTRNADLISFIDFAPTVLSIAGIKPPDYIQGKAFLGVHAEKEQREYLFTASDRFDECYDRKRAVRGKRYKYIKNFYPEVPYALPVSYREQMPMMRRMMELDASKKLQGAQKLWFAKNKPEEELYDLQNDPYELHNLALDANYTKQLQTLRAELDSWIIASDDLGGLPEQKILQKSQPNGKAQQLEKVQFSYNNGYLQMTSSRKDATILWRNSGEQAWKIYSAPITIQQGLTVEAMANRIGFDESEAAVFSE